MATYIALVNFTDQGVRRRQTTERAKALTSARRSIWESPWARSIYVHGEAADEDTFMGFAARMECLGIRTQTMRAFTAAEMAKILEGSCGQFRFDQVS